MSFNHDWTRRTFLGTVGLTTAATALPALALATPETVAEDASTTPSSQPAFAFVSHSRFAHGGRGLIQTFRVEAGQWTHVDPMIPSLYPNGIAAHPTLPILYTASNPSVDAFDQRRGRATALSIAPSGTISRSFFEKTERHWLQEINHQPLALDTCWPSGLAVSPDGRSLLVAEESGIYNILPLAEDGSLLPVGHVLKLTGSATSGARAHSVLFHPAGHIAYTTDPGTQRLHLVSLDRPQPVVSARLSFRDGSPPTHLALHPSGRFLLVGHGGGSLSVVPLQPGSGEIDGSAAHHQVVNSGGLGALLINPAGDRAYLTTGRSSGMSAGQPNYIWTLHTFRVSRSGALARLDRKPIPALKTVTGLSLHDGHLVAIGSNGIVSGPLDPRTGLPGVLNHVVQGGEYTGIVFRSL